MRINDTDIVNAARQLCEEGNSQLKIRPWNQQRHSHVPSWLTAIPAAAIIGFFLGIWTNSHMQGEAPLTALTDTVYVRVNDAPANPKALQPIDSPSAITPIHRQGTMAKSPKRHHKIPTGQPIVNDKIRYDLLVNN